MIIHHDIDNFSAKSPVITIGTFDGVHKGHQKVIDQLNEIARINKGESVIFTFYPHPRVVLSKEKSNLRLITTLLEKIEQLTKTGIDHLVVFPFTMEFAALSYETFIRSILIEKMNMNTLVVGHDHKLGKNREGSYENILSLSEKFNFNVEKIEAFLIDEVGISSSEIRTALQHGEVEKANKYLGYTFSVHGTVVEGNRIGSNIGFPTANIESSDPHKLIPAKGVYAISIMVEGILYKAMLNIGYRPTINSNADHRTIEAHIFDFHQEIYHKEATIFFHQRIRDEIKFASLDELKNQLMLDKINIKNILSSNIFPTSS